MEARMGCFKLDGSGPQQLEYLALPLFELLPVL